MHVSADGRPILTSSKLEHPQNVSTQIRVSEPEMKIEAKAEQPANAQGPIVSIKLPSRIVNVGRLEQ
jgi:hypothetical protein